MRRCTRRARPDSKRMTTYFPRRATASTRSPTSSAATSSGSSGRVRRGSRISTRVEAPADEHGLEAAANGLDFGQLGHAASVVRSG